MILKTCDALLYSEFNGMDENELKRKLESLELLIRKYTNNNFQNRNIRFCASSNGYELDGVHPFIEVGDTIQISNSKVNDGLYVVLNITDTKTVLDKKLFTVSENLITKIEYPVDVQEGVINLMKWEVENRKKVGIQSETISRHSVTYFNQDSNNQVMGYPVSLLGFLEPYKKARF